MQQTANSEQRTREPTANAPFFSIIVPVYNVAPYLRECLDSVLAQTFTDWECLCVDDGSTDESGAILDEYAQRDARFRIFHKKNGGVSSARNLALGNAKGNWIWFVDGDDAIAPYALNVLQEKLNCYPEAKAITLEIVGERINLENAFSTFAQEGTCQFIAERRNEDILEFSITATLLLHRATIGILRFPSFRLGEDGLFALEYYSKIKSWIKTDFKLYFYRDRLTSVCHEKASAALVTEWLKSYLSRFYMLTSQESFRRDEVKTYFEDTALAYFYCHGRVLSLAKEDLGQIFQLWHLLNCSVNSIAPFNFRRRSILAVLRVIPSPWLMWLLVVKTVQLRTALGHLRRSLFNKIKA